MKPNENVIYAVQEIIDDFPDSVEREGMYSLAEMVRDYEQNLDAYTKRRKMFVSILGDLTDLEVQEVVSIMHLGRGDFQTFSDAYEYNKPNVHARRSAISYMLGKSPLKKYLQRGLDKIAV